MSEPPDGRTVSDWIGDNRPHPTPTTQPCHLQCQIASNWVKHGRLTTLKALVRSFTACFTHSRPVTRSLNLDSPPHTWTGLQTQIGSLLQSVQLASPPATAPHKQQQPMLPRTAHTHHKLITRTLSFHVAKALAPSYVSHAAQQARTGRTARACITRRAAHVDARQTWCPPAPPHVHPTTSRMSTLGAGSAHEHSLEVDPRVATEAELAGAKPRDVPPADAYAELMARRKRCLDPDARRRVMPDEGKRSEWRDHPMWFSSMASHFLDIHGHFRYEMDRLMEAAAPDTAASTGTLDALNRVRRSFRAFCGGLHHHHTLEERVVFDPLKTKKPELTDQMDMLWGDHDEVVALQDKARHLIDEAVDDASAATGAKATEAVRTFVAYLRRHLDQEEDVLVPMMLDGSLRRLIQTG